LRAAQAALGQLTPDNGHTSPWQTESLLVKKNLVIVADTFVIITDSFIRK